MSIQLVVVDDHRLFAQALAGLLEADGRIEVIGIAHDGGEAVRLASELLPDVVLMDVRMPGMDGIEATRRIARTLPSVKVVVVAGSNSVEDVERAWSAGAVGYVTKDRIGLELIDVALTAADIGADEVAASFSASALPM